MHPDRDVATQFVPKAAHSGPASPAMKAAASHKVIATNRLGEPVFASPALSNGVIFIRGEKHLYPIGK